MRGRLEGILSLHPLLFCHNTCESVWQQLSHWHQQSCTACDSCGCSVVRCPTERCLWTCLRSFSQLLLLPAFPGSGPSTRTGVFRIYATSGCCVTGTDSPSGEMHDCHRTSLVERCPQRNSCGPLIYPRLGAWTTVPPVTNAVALFSLKNSMNSKFSMPGLYPQQNQAVLPYCFPAWSLPKQYARRDSNSMPGPTAASSRAHHAPHTVVEDSTPPGPARCHPSEPGPCGGVRHQLFLW
jgi:hypothetical protein